MRQLGMLMVLILTASFVYAQDVTVSANENPTAEADFDKYKTFKLANDTYKGETDAHKDRAEMTGSVQKDKTGYDGDKKDKTKYAGDKKEKMGWKSREHHIGKEIKSEMEGLGYTYAETNPDLIVTYQVLDEPGTIVRFEGSRSIATPDPSHERYEAEAGTLMVSIMDREQSEVIWQGFVSGLKDKDNRFTSEETKIRVATEILFDRYSYRGDDISIR